MKARIAKVDNGKYIPISANTGRGTPFKGGNGTGRGSGRGRGRGQALTSSYFALKNSSRKQAKEDLQRMVDNFSKRFTHEMDVYRAQVNLPSLLLNSTNEAPNGASNIGPHGRMPNDEGNRNIAPHGNQEFYNSDTEENHSDSPNWKDILKNLEKIAEGGLKHTGHEIVNAVKEWGRDMKTLVGDTARKEAKDTIKDFGKDAEDAFEDIFGEHITHVVSDVIKNKVKDGESVLSKQGRHAIGSAIGKDTVHEIKREIQKVTKQILRAQYERVATFVGHKLGIVIEEGWYDEFVNQFAELCHDFHTGHIHIWDHVKIAAEDAFHYAVEQGLEASGLGTDFLEKYGFQFLKNFQDIDLERFVGRGCRYALEKVGQTIEKDTFLDKFLEDPSLRHAARIIIRKFTDPIKKGVQDAYETAVGEVQKLMGIIDAIEEAGTAAEEAELCAEFFVEMSPLLML